MSETREPQYEPLLRLRRTKGPTTLGLMSACTWNDDPKRLLFVMARYKFVAKMFSGAKSVLEVGCADAFATRIVRQETDSVTAVDFDPVFIEEAGKRSDSDWPIDLRVHDILAGPVEGSFDAAYSLDVLEHITPADEHRFIGNIVGSLHEHGMMIVGSPSLNSQAYASAQSREGHINCKDHVAFKSLLHEFFEHVFLFSMNDEVLHTGFYPMAHYFMALCCGKKPSSE